MDSQKQKQGFLQHKVRPEVKSWIEQASCKQERSQAWFLNKLVEDAYAAAKTEQKQGVAA